MKAIVYARYSSEQQRDASVEDQLRLCRELAGRLGLEVAGEFADRALSAATTRRPGYQAMLEHVRAGGTDVVLAEGLDRLGRDQEDVAALFKRLSFLGVRIVTVAEGEVGDLHVGLKGAMNALHLKDLEQKTRRGLAGRVRQGRSAGGLCYGYAVAPGAPGRDGAPERGGRAIVPAEAAIVRRVFAEFAGGGSPKAIARRLNAEGVPGPRGERRRDGTIRGHRARGTGLLNNELYAGRLVWNRQRFVKDPASGKRLARPNPPAEWVVEEVPELRVVDDALWWAAKARQEVLDGDPRLVKAKATRFWERRRVRHLLTGLMTCGVCGHAYASVGRDYLACVGARTMGVCTQRAGLKRAAAEEAVLAVVKERLLTPDAVAAFVASFTEEVNHKRDEQLGQRRTVEVRLAQAERKLRGLYDAIAEGLRTPGLLGQLQELEAERDRLVASVAEAGPTPVRLHPNLPELYRRKVAQLREALQDPRIRDEAVDLLRGLIAKVTVRPGPSYVDLAVEGALTAMLALAAGARAEQFASCSGSTVKVVAGARNHRELMPLVAAV